MILGTGFEVSQDPMPFMVCPVPSAGSSRCELSAASVAVPPSAIMNQNPLEPKAQLSTTFIGRCGGGVLSQKYKSNWVTTISHIWSVPCSKDCILWPWPSTKEKVHSRILSHPRHAGLVPWVNKPEWQPQSWVYLCVPVVHSPCYRYACTELVKLPCTHYSTTQCIWERFRYVIPGFSLIQTAQLSFLLHSQKATRVSEWELPCPHPHLHLATFLK